MIRINSKKIARSRNGRARHDFAGTYTDETFGVVFSTGNLILNLSDGARIWSVSFDRDATEFLRARFAEPSGAAKQEGGQ